MKKTLLRVVSMAMAVAMLMCSANLTVFAAGSGSSDPTPIASAVANSDTWQSALTQQEIAVLNVDAFNFGDLKLCESALNNSVVTVVADGGDKYTVKTPAVATDLISGAKWVAKKASVVGGNTELTFDITGTETAFEYAGAFTNVQVTYELTVVDVSNVKTIVDLPNTLVGDVKRQSSVMDTLVANSTDIALIEDPIIISILKGIYDTSPAGLQQIDKLQTKCMTNGKLNLLTYINEYKEDGLIYYYTDNNSTKIYDELVLLIEVVDALINDPAFEVAKANQFVGQYTVKVEDYYDKLIDYRDKLDTIKVDEHIDQDSANLIMLLTAVAAADGYTSEHVVASNELKYTKTVQAAAPGKAIIDVTVKVLGSKPETYTASYSLASDAKLTQTNIDDLTSIKNELLDKVQANVEYYAFAGELPAIGTSVTDITAAITFTYTPYTYTVKIEGVGNRTFSSDADWTISLPAPAAGYRNVYNVAGETVYAFGSAVKYTFTDLSVFDSAKTLTVSCITEEYVEEVGKDELLTLVGKANDAFASGNLGAKFVPVEDANGNISIILRVAPSISGLKIEQIGGKLMEIFMKDLEVAYLGDSVMWSKTDGIHIQAFIDMFASSGFGFDAFCNVVGADGRVKNDAALSALSPVGSAVAGGVGGKLAESTITLNGSRYPFYITLQDGVATSQLAKARELVAKLKGYINIECSNGAYNIVVNAPDSVYPYYLAAMLALDKAELADPQDMDMKECLEYEFSLIKPLILDDNFTVETLENTLAKAGQAYDLSEYATEFDYIRRMMSYILRHTTVESTASGNVYSATSKTESADAIKRLLGRIDMASFYGIVAEAQDGSTIDFNFTITLADMETEYDALVFDYSKTGLNKFVATKDLAATLNSVGANAIVVLMNDVTLNGAVDIKNRTFINLNGYTITGDMNATAAVRITDATLYADKGGVNGKLTGNFTLTGGKYTANVDAFLASGYSIDANGYVVNNVYTVTKTGNDVEIALNADFLYDYSSVSSAKKEFLLETAVDAAFDIALNMYTAAAIQIDGNTVYDFSTIKDIVSLLDNSKNQLANKAIDVVDTLGVSAIVNAIISDVCDFAALEQAILNGTAVAEYEVTTKSWNFTPYVQTNGNYLTIDITPANEKTGKLSIVVAGTDANKQALAAIFGELKNIVTVDVAEIIVNDVSYNGGFNVDYNATADVTVDLSSNNDYAALVATAVAYKLPAGAQKDAIVAALDVYFTTRGTEELVAVLENVTAAQVIAAIKGLGNETCENMLTALGFTSDSVVALEAVYGYMIDTAAKVLNRLDITGPATTLKGFKVDNTFAAYNWTKDNIKGYNVDVAFTLVLASEKPAELPVEIDDPTADISSAEAQKLIRGFYYDVAVNDVYVDAKCMGITVGELLTYVKFNITNASTSDIYVVDREGNKCANDALVGTGYSIVINASNSVSAETLNVRIIVVGDVNGNGKVDSGDAAMMARHYLGIELLNEAQIFAADNNRNGKVDSGDAARIAAKYTYTWDGNTYESFYKA